MKALKNILVGFTVSFLGSIPLGYLNIIGFQIDSEWGNESLVWYLFGVISVEAFVIYFTLIFAQTLAQNKKLIRIIEVFSIFFMLLLAILFYLQSKAGTTDQNYLEKYVDYPPFVIGVIFNGLNFAQIPFWIGWNLYVVNEKYISAEKKFRLGYVFGTLAGSFFGILAIVKALQLLTAQSAIISGYLMAYVIPLFFLGMAIYQTVKFYKKHIASANK